MSITLTKFNCFVEDLAEKAHNLGSDTLKLALTNTAPAATDATWNLSAHPAPAAAFGYTAGGVTITVNSSAQTSGTYKLVVANTSFTADGGNLGPFRYLVLYNSTASNKGIGFFDYGQNITLQDGDMTAVNFDQSNGVIQVI